MSAANTQPSNDLPQRLMEAARRDALTWEDRIAIGQAIGRIQGTSKPGAPAYADNTPHLNVGDSAFEDWYQSYLSKSLCQKQIARDAYAAGMGDPLVVAAPANETGGSAERDPLPPGWVAIPIEPSEEQWTVAQGTLLDMGWPATLCLAMRLKTLVQITRSQWERDGGNPQYSKAPAQRDAKVLADAVLAHLDALKDESAAHIWPWDLQKCMTSECTAEVASVRMGSPEGMTLPLFSRAQVEDALRAARQTEGGAA